MLRGLRMDAVLIASMVLGIAVGAVISCNMDEASLAGIYAGGVYDPSENWFAAFFSYFLSSAAFVTAAFLMGFSPLSHPFEIMLVCFKGMGLGVLAGSIYSCDNIPVCLALFLPFAVVSSGILIYQSMESLDMSTRYLDISITSENRIGLAREFRDYIFRFVILLVACGAVSSVNCLVLRIFSSQGLI